MRDSMATFRVSLRHSNHTGGVFFGGCIKTSGESAPEGKATAALKEYLRTNAAVSHMRERDKGTIETRATGMREK